MNKTQEIRELARQVAEKAHSLDNWRKRSMWCKHNDLTWYGPPPINVNMGGCFKEILPADCLGAVDQVYRIVETELRKKLWYDELGDDKVIEPWVGMNAIYYDDPISMWGVEAQFSEYPHGQVFHGEIEKPEDVHKLHIPFPHLDGTRTLEQYDRARELLDGILDVRMEWRCRHLVYPNFGVWAVRFIGLQRFMEWCATNPEEIKHFIFTFHMTYLNHNLIMEGRRRLTDNNCLVGEMYPWNYDVAEEPVRLKDMWVHSDSQEWTLISPEMMEEYFMPSQRDVFSYFGHGSFGCCESLDRKWGLVKSLPNLRRITLSERVDWKQAIKAMGDKYVYVVRPSIANTIFCGDEDSFRKDLMIMVKTFKGLHWEINFPTDGTLNGDTERLHRWVKMAREVLYESY